MTSTITRNRVASRTARLTRHVGGIEFPAAGTWSVSGSHTDVAFSLPRRLRRTERWRGRAVAATIVVGEDPDDLLVVVVLDAARATVTGRAGGAAGSRGCLVARSGAGPLPWAVSGELRPNRAVLAVCATLSDHGVWRRGDRAYGWFALAGAIVPYRVGGGQSVRFSFDLLADGPDTGSGVA